MTTTTVTANARAEIGDAILWDNHGEHLGRRDDVPHRMHRKLLDDAVDGGHETQELRSPLGLDLIVGDAGKFASGSPPSKSIACNLATSSRAAMRSALTCPCRGRIELDHVD
ncbi:hypothetical protein [Bradyrhizobium huanghuaihaiense]|uniref:hypothetical protein n=1 Tax=Bradyrhizobium huanghuaihaiense TaxID=990078 RepID=UPI0003A9D5B1|nr:hypothetical protein [Bradyrhizobium huanghuaihaiense]